MIKQTRNSSSHLRRRPFRLICYASTLSSDKHVEIRRRYSKKHCFEQKLSQDRNKFWEAALVKMAA